MFHSENGLFFSRNEDGSVTITKYKDANPESEVEFTQTLPDGVWCSAVCCVSVKGEGDNRWYSAMDFHNK